LICLHGLVRLEFYTEVDDVLAFSFQANLHFLPSSSWTGNPHLPGAPPSWRLSQLEAGAPRRWQLAKSVISTRVPARIACAIVSRQCRQTQPSLAFIYAARLHRAPL